MYICLCNAITDKQIEAAICDGACTVDCLKRCLGVSTQCGKCACHVEQILLDARAQGANSEAEAA